MAASRGSPSAPAGRVIRASEIGQYAFCAHAWWLGAVEGLPSTHRGEMVAGEASHRQHGRTVRTTSVLARLAYVLLGLAVLAAVVALLRGLS